MTGFLLWRGGIFLKHNMEPIINEYFSCHQALLATYASYQKRNYDMIFSESWGFGYQKDDNPFGSSLNPSCQDRRRILLEKFHGIKTEDRKYEGIKNLLEIIQSTLTHSPILLFCDVFNCPWNIAYRRNHIDHYVLITGLDYSAKQVNILDPYSTKDENTIDVEKIAPCDGNLSFFIMKPLQKPKEEDYHFEIVNSCDHIKKSDFMQSLESFCNDMQIRFDELLHVEYTDEYAIPLIINLRRIANQRYCYCIFLNHLVDKKMIASYMLEIMESIAEKYALLRILLIKQILKKRKSVECTDILNEIMSKEYEAYENMKSFI